MAKARGKTESKKPARIQVQESAAAPPPAPTTLVLRTCPADMVATGKREDGGTYSMRWPRQGPVEAPDWDPTPRCGGGLHGLPWGNGDWSLLSSADDAVWQVFEVDTATLVDIDGTKSKFQRGNVLFSGSRVDAVIRVLCGSEAMAHAIDAAKVWGEKSGYSSKAASSGDYSTAASSGNSSKAASSGNSSKAACAGSSGIAASIGNSGMAKAGPLGLVIVTHWVEAEKRYRACVGNVGEGGIKADTWYRVVDGKLVAE